MAAAAIPRTTWWEIPIGKDDLVSVELGNGLNVSTESSVAGKETTPASTDIVEDSPKEDQPQQECHVPTSTSLSELNEGFCLSVAGLGSRP